MQTSKATGAVKEEVCWSHAFTNKEVDEANCRDLCATPDDPDHQGLDAPAHVKARQLRTSHKAALQAAISYTDN